MNCQDTQRLLHGFVDCELDLRTSLEVDEHLGGCPACARAHRSLEALRAAVRSEAPYYEPSAQLQGRIRAAVRGARPADPGRPRRVAWLRVAAALLFLSVAAWGLTRVLPLRPAAPVWAEELVASHVRSQMLAGHLVDVESSDRHTVKPWFEGKLDFAPDVPDLAGDGFPLVGGRLDYMDGRPVAALVYQCRKHLINLFVWPARQETNSPPTAFVHRGYHLLLWTRSGTAYRAVSDLNDAELREFAGLVQDRTRPRFDARTP